MKNRLFVALGVAISFAGLPCEALSQGDWTQWSNERRLMADLIADDYEIRAATPGGGAFRHVYLQKGKNVFICIDSFQSIVSLSCASLQKPRQR